MTTTSNVWTSPRVLLRPPPEVALLGLRAMKMVACADGPFRPGARRLLTAAQRIVLGTEVDLDGLAAIAPAELAAGMPAPLRTQFASAMVLMTLTDGRPTAPTLDLVQVFAGALGVDEPGLRAVSLMAHGHLLVGALDFHRRSNVGAMLRDEIESRGLLGAVRAVLGLRGLSEDPLVAEPFVALGDLPPGTLGRCFFDHCRARGFGFPGEKHGFPESGVYHDFTHVLAGYDTDPYGEIQIGAFTAGYRRHNPLFVAMLPLLLFAADINVSGIPHDHVDAIFSRPGVAESYLRAMERGGKVKVDLSDHWDFWPEVRRPIDDVRRDLGIEPQ
jgi:hypothetical protein